MDSQIDSKEIKIALTDIQIKLEKCSLEDEKKSLEEMTQKLLTQLDGENRSIQRLYFCYLIIEFLDRPNLDEELMINFIRTLFPQVLYKRQLALISEIISLALRLRHSKLLNCMEFYLNNDSLEFPSIEISPSLAEDSPLFCAAVISQGFFNNNDRSKEYLTEWLKTLVDLIPINTITMNYIIRHSLIEQPDDYDLHLAILNVIKNKKCKVLSNHFLGSIIQKLPVDNDNLIDRFAQMLIIMFANNMAQQSNLIKNSLIEKFGQNILIKAVCK